MALHLFVFLLVVSLLLLLMLLLRLDWFLLQPSSPKGVAKRSRLPRSLCPATRTIAWPVVTPPSPRRL